MTMRRFPISSKPRRSFVRRRRIENIINMINTTIFKSAFILVVVLQSSRTWAHPVDMDVEIQSSKPIGGDHYDQRQNGTKNFRIHVDGVVFVMAPAQALLLAAELDPSSLLAMGQEGFGESSKPDTNKPIVEDVQKPIKQKSAHSHGLRLGNLLGPLLRRIAP